MWSVIGILFAAALIAIIEVPPLLKRRMTKELVAFSVLLVIGTGIAVAKNAKVPLPNPLNWIGFAFQPASDAILSFLGQKGW